MKLITSHNSTIIVVSTVIALFISACKINYSFTGASISPEVKTISVDFIENRAPLAPPTISQNFTEDLKDIFISQTSLNLIKSGGDLHFEGYISGYRNDPVAISGNETAELNRLTISVSITFINMKDEKQNFTKSFSKFADYNSSQSLSSVEEGLIEQINEQLTQEIFNASVSNW